MKLGVIARAEDRGLGIQSWEACRHLKPSSVLVVDVQNAEGFDMHLDRYPGAPVARLDAQGRLGESLVRDWLADLDVVLSFETLYDWRLADWARDAGARTVVQVNPEFYLHGHMNLPAPDAWWNPTTWRMEHLPDDTRHVPVPVALDRFPNGVWPTRNELTPGPLRVLHVVGRRAVADRNGTELLYAAMKKVRADVELTVKEQRPGVEVGEADYWRLYDDQDVLVMPRRFGGLCLPAQEAMAAGLAVVMPSCPPNTDWPIAGAVWSWNGQLPVPCGTLPLVRTDVGDLAATIDRLASDPAFLRYFETSSIRWAQSHSWEALLPLYEAELDRVSRIG